MTETSESPEKNTDDLLLEHEYDGIREYDNPLPRWWSLIFLGTCLYALGHGIHYASGKGQSVSAEYEAEMRLAGNEEAARAAGEKPSEEALQKLASNQAAMQDTQALFTLRCAACHGDRGQGLIGPNLTDAYWIHGKGSLMDVYTVVSEGVLAKGMPAWNKQLTPVELRKLVAYVGSIANTNVPGKAPEGESSAAGSPK